MPSINEPVDTLLDWRELSKDKKEVISYIKALKAELAHATRKLGKVRAQENELYGVQLATMTKRDLTALLVDAICTDLPITEVFKQHESRYHLPGKWASRLLARNPNKSLVESSIKSLSRNGALAPILQCNLIDQKEFYNAKTYRQLCRKLRNAYRIAQRLKMLEENNKFLKESVTENSRLIASLQNKLLVAQAGTLAEKANALLNQGRPKKRIAQELGVSLSTLQRHLSANKMGAPK